MKEDTMSRWARARLVVLLILMVTPVRHAQARSDADCLYSGEHSDGARYCITMPPTPPPYDMWKGDLIFFSHGYVSADKPFEIPWSQMTLIDENGNAFATNSCNQNGLAVQQGFLDMIDLIDVFNCS